MDLIASFNAHKVKTSHFLTVDGIQKVTTYPCVSHGISIEGTNERDFYFDFSFEDVSLPLLGTSFSDDCAYSHTINGTLTVTGMKKDAGMHYYEGRNVLDFDKVTSKFSDLQLQ